MLRLSTSDGTLAPVLPTAVLDHAATAPTVSPAPSTCLNCGGAVPDHFCGHCGQGAHTHRYSLGHFLHEIPHTVLHVDKGLFYTAKELTLRPAPTLRRFLAGQRARHFQPLAYVLIIVGLSSFVYAALHLQVQVGDNSVGPAGRVMQEHFASSYGKYFRWLTVGALPLTALVTWALLRRAALNYAECLVVNAYLLGTMTLITMPFYVPYYLFNGTPQTSQVSLCSMTVMFAYQTWAFAGLLAPTGHTALRRYARGLITTVLGFVIMMLVAWGVIVSLNWPVAREAFRESKQRALEARRAQTVANAHP